jgi:hypothetical protein
VPAVLVDATDLTYPSTSVFEILSHQIAIDIRMKQRQDPSDILRRKNELWAMMIKQISRDEFKPEPIRNVYQTGRAFAW